MAPDHGGERGGQSPCPMEQVVWAWSTPQEEMLFPIPFPGGQRGRDSDLVQIRTGEGFPQGSPCPWVGDKKEVEMGLGGGGYCWL